MGNQSDDASRWSSSSKRLGATENMVFASAAYVNTGTKAAATLHWLTLNRKERRKPNFGG